MAPHARFGNNASALQQARREVKSPCWSVPAEVSYSAANRVFSFRRSVAARRQALQGHRRFIGPGVDREPGRERRQRALSPAPACQFSRGGEALADDRLAPTALVGGDAVAFRCRELADAGELGDRLRRARNGAEALFGVKAPRVPRRAVRGGSKRPQPKVGKVVDDLHSVGAGARRQIPAPGDGLISSSTVARQSARAIAASARS
jgi:hypothetical protein